MPFIGQTFKCSRENCVGQLKHSFFSRLAAILAGVKRLKRGAVTGAPLAASFVVATDGGAGSSRCLLMMRVGTDLACTGRSPAMVSRCSYTRAKAMASSNVVGCSSSTSVRADCVDPR
jgi:hypothetical protein